MSTIAIDNHNFRATLSRSGVVMVDCWASWCGGCAAFESTFNSMSQRYPEVTFAKLDTGSHPDLSDAVGVTQVPTLLIYRDGLLLLRHPGGVDETALESIVAQAVSLDMNVVRAEMEREAHEAGQPVTS